jgi:hypothetical protein
VNRGARFGRHFTANARGWVTVAYSFTLTPSSSLPRSLFLLLPRFFPAPYPKPAASNAMSLYGVIPGDKTALRK